MQISQCIVETYYTGEYSIEDAINNIDLERRPQTLEAAKQEDAMIFAQEPEALTGQKYYKVTIIVQECPEP